MASAEPWEQLQTQIRAALERSAAASWFEIWRLFLEDPWYQAELAKHARSVVRSSGASPGWIEDVQHEAMLILAGKLQRKINLGLDSRVLAEKFPAVIGKIARNECRQALKRLRRIYRSGTHLSNESDQLAVMSSRSIDEQSLDLSAAIEELPEPLRSVLRLYHLGFDIRVVAGRLGLSYWQAYRAFQHGIERLRKEFE